MGFREGAFATVWSMEKFDNFSKVRISTSRKDKQKDEYVTDFSGFVTLVAEAHKKADKIQNELVNSTMCRIKLGGCDVSSKYDKEAKREYVNFTLFDFYTADDEQFNSSQNSEDKSKDEEKKKSSSLLEDNSVDNTDDDDGDCPF